MLHSQHHGEGLRAAIVDVELAVEQCVGMITREEVLEASRDLYVSGPVSHPYRDCDKKQADRGTIAEDMPADADFNSVARFVHRPAPLLPEDYRLSLSHKMAAERKHSTLRTKERSGKALPSSLLILPFKVDGIRLE